MAANENRSVTIKINGKEVENSAKAIRSEFYSLRKEVDGLTRGTKEYRKKAAELKRVQGVLDDHRNKIRGVKSAWSGMGGMIKSAILPMLSIGAITSAISGAIQTTKEFNQALDELQAITGADVETMEFLKNEAQSVGIQFGKSATEVVQAYKLMASAKPELLSNAEALNEMTLKAMTLSKATKKDLATSVSDLTTIMNANNASVEQADRYINVLAAASQKGAQEVPYLSQALRNVGPGADAAGIAIERNVAVLETFGEKGLEASKAGTQFRNILITMQGDQRNYTNGQFDFNKAMENLQPIMNDTVALTKIFGKENVAGAQILAQNKDRVDELTIAITGTDTAYTQAAINSDNLASAQERMKSSYDSLMLSLMESDGILTAVTDLFAGLTEATAIAIREHKGFKDALVESQINAEGLTGAAADLERAYAKLSDAQTLYDRVSSSRTKEKLRLAQEEVMRIEQQIAAERSLNAEKKKAVALIDKKGIEGAQKELIQLYEDTKLLEEKFRETGSVIYNPEQLQREVEALDQALQEARAVRAKNQAALEKEMAAKAGKDGAGLSRVMMDTIDRIDPSEAPEVITAREIENAKQAIMDEGLALRNENHEKFLEEEKKREFENQLEIKRQKIDMIREAADVGFQLLSGAVENNKNKELQALEEKKNQGLISEEDYEKQKEEIQRKAFNKKKALDIAQAVINGALAITKVTAQMGALSPMAIPSIVASTAGQVALIAAQKFEKGGMFDVLQGPSHAQNGMPVIDPSTGQVRAELEGGEYITRKNSVNARTLPVLRAINETGDIPNINYASASNNLQMASGGSFGGGVGDAAAAEIRAMRNDMMKWQREFRVNLPLQDLEDEQSRKGKVEKYAGIAS